MENSDVLLSKHFLVTRSEQREIGKIFESNLCPGLAPLSARGVHRASSGKEVFDTT